MSNHFFFEFLFLPLNLVLFRSANIHPVSIISLKLANTVSTLSKEDDFRKELILSLPQPKALETGHFEFHSFFGANYQ